LKKVLAFICIMFFISACLTNECEVGSIRCSGSLLQVCSSDNEWVQSVDCNNVEPKELNWVCCPSKDSCVPQGECK